jgi:tetratricopeptide (TPR) repeat protein
MLKGLAAMHDIGFDGNRPYHLALLAKTYAEMGRLKKALSTLQEAFAAAAQGQELKQAADRHRLKGELLLKQSEMQVAEAQNCFERAIEFARTQGARSLELQATMSLGRLLAKQGRREEARAMVAEIYNWFTEGFDTADLKGAKALLDELSR